MCPALTKKLSPDDSFSAVSVRRSTEGTYSGVLSDRSCLGGGAANPVVDDGVSDDVDPLRRANLDSPFPAIAAAEAPPTDKTDSFDGDAGSDTAEGNCCSSIFIPAYGNC